MYEEAINQAVKDWEAMARDAARYRELRQSGVVDDPMRGPLFARDLDAHADRLIAMRKDFNRRNGS